MSGLIQLLIRHALTLLAAALAAHHFTDVSTSGGIALAVLLLLFGVAWSWIVKAMHLENKFGDVTANESLRTLLGAVISQGVTFLSGYFAIDANDPNLLALALVNTVASRYGVHQQIAHATPIDVAAAVKALVLMLCVSMLVSCAGLTAFLSSPAGEGLEVALVNLGTHVAVEKKLITPGQSITVQGVNAIISDPNDSTLNKVVKLVDVGLKDEKDAGILNDGDSVLIKNLTTAVIKYATKPAGKTPVSVTPGAASAAVQSKLKLEQRYVPACLQLAAE